MSFNLPYRGLPRELRDQIYESLLSLPGGLIFKETSSNSKLKCVSDLKIDMTLANRQVYNEAMAVLLTKNTFDFRTEYIEVVLEFLQHLPRTVVCRIESLIVPAEKMMVTRAY